jgi:hypothetical protein
MWEGSVWPAMLLSLKRFRAMGFLPTSRKSARYGAPPILVPPISGSQFWFRLVLVPLISERFSKEKQFLLQSRFSEKAFAT